MPEKRIAILDKLLDRLGLVRKSQMNVAERENVEGNIPFGLTILQGQAAEVRMDIRLLIKEYARDLQLQMRELLLNTEKINDLPILKQERENLRKSLDDLAKTLPNEAVKSGEISAEYVAKLSAFITQLLKVPEFQQILDKYIDAARDIPNIFDAEDLPYIPVKYMQGLQGHMEKSALEDLHEALRKEIISTLDYTRAAVHPEEQASFQAPELEICAQELDGEELEP